MKQQDINKTAVIVNCVLAAIVVILAYLIHIAENESTLTALTINKQDDYYWYHYSVISNNKIKVIHYANYLQMFYFLNVVVTLVNLFKLNNRMNWLWWVLNICFVQVAIYSSTYQIISAAILFYLWLNKDSFFQEKDSNSPITDNEATSIA